MTATAARVLADSSDVAALAMSNEHYVALPRPERFQYRIAMLDVATMLANDVRGCDDLDNESVDACLEAIHEWYSQLKTLSDHLD